MTALAQALYLQAISTGGVSSPTTSVRAARAGRLAGPRLPPPRCAQLAARRAGSMGLAISRSIVGRSTEVHNGRSMGVQVVATKAPVAITGATGFVGSALVRRLTALGYPVRVLTREVASAQRKVRSGGGVTLVSPAQWEAAIKGCGAVVNLSGEPISTRWTPTIKREIMNSRVNTTNRLANALQACEATERPAVLVSASAVGFYGVSDTSICFDETSAAGRDYLADVCVAWEAAAAKATVERTVVMRLGIVLDNGGGAMAKMLPIFQLGAGGPLGGGRQWFSWIHRDDAVAMLVEAIENPQWRGVYNATAPQPVRMGEMCAALGSAASRPSWLPVPEFALQALLGEGATVVLEGQQVKPMRALEAGFTFKYATIAQAMQAIIRNA